jgi:cyclohexanone monooxygenase
MESHVDALIIGAGFGGICQLHSLIQIGISARVIDAAGDVGGTWYWNRYPGAMSDTESYVYRFSWDKEDLQSYPWTHHYLKQPEILKYLEHVVEKHKLRQYMHFQTEMLSADWTDGYWKVKVSTGEVFVARYVITALGLLSRPNLPNITGLSDFGGEVCHTASWQPELQLKGKRVAIIGCGSTGVQVITAIAKEVKELICFQRHPQYSVPSGDGPVEPEYRERVNKNYSTIFEQVRNSAVGFGFDEPSRLTMSVSAEEREEIFEDLWQKGNGFRFLMGGFSDIATSKEANEEACKFIRKKIGQIVKDPEKAKKLMPTDYYARRPLCDGGYFQQFNLDHVSIVDLKATPIERITESGIQIADGSEYAVDVIILATGFDAIDGNYNRIRIHGVDGKTLKDHWSNGPTSYLGVSVPDFPNLFMITGPQGPFCNVPPAIESHVEFITEAIQHAEQTRHKSGGGIIEATHEAESDWNAFCNKSVEGNLFKETASWIFGNNVAGKPVALRFYFGGLHKFRIELQRCIDNGWAGFKPI